MESETIFFDPAKHPNNTWKSFRSFCIRFELRYSAQFTDPPKTAIDSALQRWTLEHPAAQGEPEVKPTVQVFDRLKEEWKAKDKVAKVLGMFSAPRLYEDWLIAQPVAATRNNATWENFKTTMEGFYRPTENSTLNNYQFRSLVQQDSETFASFCVRVEKEAKGCTFKCNHADCSAESIAVRDQIIIGTTSSKIREDALLKSWNLGTLRTEGIKLESACRKEDSSHEIYEVDIFKVNSTGTEFKTKNHKNKDFTVEVMVNGSITVVVADTGARVSVCGKLQAQKWNLLSKMLPTAVKIKPYNSPAVPALGVARCAVTFGSTSIPVLWYILEGTCQPILSGSAAVNLGIIHFTNRPTICKPINMINAELNKSDQERIQNVVARHSDVFRETLGKHKKYEVKLITDPGVKPVVSPPRATPYHLQDRLDSVLQSMINNDVIEEHPVGEPTPWISNAVYVPKPDGSLRVTLDARNINKAIQSSNLPIPRQEDIKAKLGGSKVKSKIDFKTAFWQLLLGVESRPLTVFSMNNKLYRYKRLIMGVKSAQGELNAALSPLFRDIPDAHLIHDDLIIGSKNMEDHLEALEKCLSRVQEMGLTLNEEKCQFGMKEVKFWGMIVNDEGVQPDPEKVEALVDLERPRNKDELLSFLCMMQSVAEFIPSFAKKSAPLRELTGMKSKFRWEEKHQQCFQYLLSEFRKDVLLRYFDISKPTYLLTDAHKTGLGAILAQGDSMETALPVAIASRTTTDAEKNYPQIDLEGLAVDYALFRFRNYIIGSPRTITVITDHQPLCAVFNGSKIGSVRTDRFKQRNQDIRFKVVYQKGKKNQSDFISRRATPIKKLSDEEQQRSDSINNLLYTLHTTPIIDKITLKSIAEETANDEVLVKLTEIVKSGKTWVPKEEEEAIQKFKPLISEITITGNGILLKGDRIILPTSLQPLAIQLAHQGSHPGQSSMERRLRYHFFFHNMNVKVASFLADCMDCKIYTDKKCKEPLKSHEVPEKCWEKVSVDLFGPMPSRNHVLVIQDMASRFPAAKIVPSTSAEKVLPAMTEVYNSYGSPQVQLSDNGPPFNSGAMKRFADERGIELEKIPPLHPSANPVETFMRPLGKTMKIAHHNGVPEKTALNQLLQNYRDTPHPSTGIPPAAMLFRDSIAGVFPKKSIPDSDVETARNYDKLQKCDKQDTINSSKYKKTSNITVGDPVLVRNYRRRSKFQPIFAPEQYVVTGISDYGRKLKIERVSDGQELIRHPDDLKVHEVPSEPDQPEIITPRDGWKTLSYNQDDWDFSDWCDFRQAQPPLAAPQDLAAAPAAAQQDRDQPPDVRVPAEHPANQEEVRRSGRRRNSPDRLGAHAYDQNRALPGENAVTRAWCPGYTREQYED